MFTVPPFKKTMLPLLVPPTLGPMAMGPWQFTKPFEIIKVPVDGPELVSLAKANSCPAPMKSVPWEPTLIVPAQPAKTEGLKLPEVLLAMMTLLADTVPVSNCNMPTPLSPLEFGVRPVFAPTISVPALMSTAEPLSNKLPALVPLPPPTFLLPRMMLTELSESAPVKPRILRPPPEFVTVKALFWLAMLMVAALMTLVPGASVSRAATCLL